MDASAGATRPLTRWLLLALLASMLVVAADPAAAKLCVLELVLGQPVCV